MASTEENNLNNVEELFGGGEFVLTQKDDGTILGGGYKINSFFLQGGEAPITTYNGPEQTGGKVSSPFEHLAVPAGLFYVNMRVPKKTTVPEHYNPHETISDDIMDKLYSMVEYDKKRKRKTRKHIVKNKTNKPNTRRNK